MDYIYHISSIATTFGPLSKVTILGQKCMAILGIRLKQAEVCLKNEPFIATAYFQTDKISQAGENGRKFD